MRDVAINYMLRHPAALGRRLGYGRLTDELHGPWMREMISGKEDFTLQAHRGSYKTTCLCVALVAFMVIDYLSGMAVGWLGRSGKTAGGRLDSRAGFAGLMKKGLMLLTVLMAALLDRALGGESAVFRGLMVWFYIANEGLSILENLTLAGVPFPERVKDALEQLKEK